MELVFATNNSHKIEEVQHLLKNDFKLMSLKDIGCLEEFAETGSTLEENAKEKAEYVYNKYQINCFADDTGLEIETLNGRPGVLSARYADEEKSSEKNINKVLSELKNISNRNAKFKTVISLIINTKYYLFKGIINGNILSIPKGSFGFGYDSIFVPDGFTKSFAEMTLEEKNKISHRSIAIKQLAEFLNGFKSD